MTFFMKKTKCEAQTFSGIIQIPSLLIASHFGSFFLINKLSSLYGCRPPSQLMVIE